VRGEDDKVRNANKILEGENGIAEIKMKIKHKKEIHLSCPIAAEPQNICSNGQSGEVPKV
jgi:hypothetical protein